jgi:hypothetical protein
MNHALFGVGDKTQRLLSLADPTFLYIDDGSVADSSLLDRHNARLFDPTRHHFNPLTGMTYMRARAFADAIYSASPQGKDTLTVRNGKRALTRLLLNEPTRLDKLPRHAEDPGTAEALATIDDMLLSPVLRSVLCSSKRPFSFKGRVVARISRAELGDFDAYLLASLLVGQFQGQVIVPDFGFYGRDFFSQFVRENRLVASVSFLSEVSVPLQQLLLSVKDKTIYRTTPEDAKRLVFYTRHTEPRNLMEQGEGEFLTTIPQEPTL